jgi:hypothetical protein
MTQLPALTPLQVRVLGVLVEKEHTVPDTYPLSLNALTAGCNQKNNRHPAIEAAESEVQSALDGLRPLSLVIESSGMRVTRYTHNLGRVLRIPEQSVALLAALMLRGPQTAAELRTAAERMHRFADVSSVQAFLDELSQRPDAAGGPLVHRLARAPGEREARWAQLLSALPEPAAPPEQATVARGSSPSGIEAMQARQEELAQEVSDLRAKLERLASRLGVQL